MGDGGDLQDYAVGMFTVTTTMGMPDGTDRAVTTVVAVGSTDDETVERLRPAVEHLLFQRRAVRRRMERE